MKIANRKDKRVSKRIIHTYIVGAILVALGSSPALAQRVRGVRAEPTPTATTPDLSTPLVAMTGVGIQALTDLTGGTLSTLTVTVTTIGNRPWGDSGWLAPQRYSAGNLTIGVYRSRPDTAAHGTRWCLVQTLSIPAAAGQTTTVTIDLSKFKASDGIEFENWPAYNVTLTATGSKTYTSSIFWPDTTPSNYQPPQNPSGWTVDCSE